ncbi:MAG TPA: hypothetical protein PLT82_04735 [Candidatus Hydrogenedens sp.]|nr:hypothetical protein [Candidatus Hydrogenedens sp.]HOL19202.1 hypothetical protein [Candidatus Hydrogenedens sp.]HPP58418.1 hypothetical protein [Candidatus Hydrogenedens sp.]
MKKTYQLPLWQENKIPKNKEVSFIPLTNKKVPILFRETIPEIPSTTYGAFEIYKYPAKFIPQVIAFILKEYAKPGIKIFDPFAGYGTVGVVSRVYGNPYELWDLNPLINVIHNTAIMEYPKVNLFELLNEIKISKKEFLPKWSNLNYWFPEEFLQILSTSWGFIYSLEDRLKYLFLIPLLNVTKYFSYADEKVHKLYKSRHSKQKITELIKKDWKTIFYNMLEKEVGKLQRKLLENKLLKPQNVEYRIKSGIDTLKEELDNEVNILITSPPYLQAQEYIRSTKLELFWLGYDETYIKELNKKEIPYCTVPEIDIYSQTFYQYREKIKERHLLLLYDRYFHGILGTFSRLENKVKNYMCIFVGPAKIRTTSIPIDDIIIEHLEQMGWYHEITYVDRIVSRVMFESKINPASGEEDSRIKTEHLIILKRG